MFVSIMCISYLCWYRSQNQRRQDTELCHNIRETYGFIQNRWIITFDLV